MPLTAKQRAETLADWGRGGGRCTWCKISLEFQEHATPEALRNGGYDLRKALFEVDHVIPQAMNGGDGPKNRQVLCQICHRQKTRVDLHEIAKTERIGVPPETETNAERLRQRAPLVRTPGR